MSDGDVYSSLAAWAGREPEAVAVLSPGQDPISFRELVHMIDAVHDLLDRAGLSRHDRVALQSFPGPDTAVVTLAVACSATCVPVSPHATVPESVSTLRETGVRALLAPAGRDSSAVEAAVSLDIPVLRVGHDEMAEGGRHVSRPPAPDDVALLIRTSGSTARPKLVPITHAQLVARADKTIRLLGLSAADRCLNVMPLNYMHGLTSGLMAPLLAGGGVVCPSSLDRDVFFDCVERLDPTWYTAGATHHLNILGWLEDRQLEHRLRFVRSGSAPLPADAITALEARLGVPVVESLSATETGTMTSNPPSWERRPGTVGTTPDDDVAVMDPQGQVVGPGQIGEVVVRGPGVVSGYDDAAMTAAKFRDGWFHTGDLGVFDTDGHLRLQGRLDDVINRGGEKISPEEVDAALLTHPGVEQALTFAQPHPTLHNEVGAAVVPRADVQLTEKDLRRYLLRHLSPSKIPRQILFTSELPMTESGKPQRRGAAAHFAEHPPPPTGPSASAADRWRARWRRLRRFLGRFRRVPLSPLERSLLECWRQVLRQEDVGVDDDFFDIGGDSLSAVLLIEMIEQRLGVTIPLQYLMEGGSVRSLALRLVRSPPMTPDVVAIQTEGRGLPIFAFCGRFGHALRLVMVGRALGPSQPFYAMQPPGMDWESVGLDTIPQFAAHYIERITEIQPEGPYRLLGTSFGGLIVFEIALQLQAAGHEVDLLAVVDTNPSTCRVDGRLDRDDGPREISQPALTEEATAAEAAHLGVAQTHIRARDAYVMEGPFDGELVYFLCEDHAPKGRDRRALWTAVATSSRVVPIPGPHASFFREPQFSALCRGLVDVLSGA